MLDMLYVNSKTKSFIRFELEGDPFESYLHQYHDEQNALEAMSTYYQQIILGFGKSIEIPSKLLEELSDASLDDMLIKLESDSKTLFVENFFLVIPDALKHVLVENESDKLYDTVGINPSVFLMKSNTAKMVSIAIVDKEAIAEYYTIVGALR